VSEVSEQTRTKVLLVEDHRMFREYLGQLINRDLGMSICGEADNIRDAMALIKSTTPDIAIVMSPCVDRVAWNWLRT